MKRICLVVGLALGAMLCSTDMSGQSWMTHTVVGSGGLSALNNGSYILTATFGQPVIGTISMNENVLNQGFWNALPRVTSYEDSPITGINENAPLRASRNPFSESTRLFVTIPESGSVSLTLYDDLGREVQRLLDEEHPAGSIQINLDARDLASGHYTLRLLTERIQQNLQLLIIQ